jgi:hypothetical protein
MLLCQSGSFFHLLPLWDAKVASGERMNKVTGTSKQRINKHRIRRSKFMSGSFCDQMGWAHHTSRFGYVKMSGVELPTVYMGSTDGLPIYFLGTA